jgi:hypothetical protein
MNRLIPLLLGALALVAFALAQRTISSAAVETPVMQAATAAPMPAPIMTPIPTLTPLPFGTPLPLGTMVPSGAPTMMP